MITASKSSVKISRFILVGCLTIVMPCYAIKPIVILTGGLGTPLGQDPQSQVFANTAFKYKPNSSSSLNPLVGGFAGLEYAFKKKWAWQFGIAYYQGARSSVNGEEIQVPVDNLDAINTWNYQYKILSRQFLVENKLSYITKKYYRPYFLLGIGERINHSYAFQVTPQNSGEVATAIFDSKVNKALVYTIGVGLDVDLTPNMRLGGGYRYAYLGKYDLGEGTLDTGAGGSVFLLPALRTNHSFNHEILIQLTYLFSGISY